MKHTTNVQAVRPDLKEHHDETKLRGLKIKNGIKAGAGGECTASYIHVSTRTNTSMKTRIAVRSLAPALFALLMFAAFTGCDSTSPEVEASTPETLAMPQARLGRLASDDLKDPSRIPIYVAEESTRRVARYTDLPLDQQRMIDASLSMLRSPSLYPKSNNLDLTFGDAGVAAAGCGVNSTKAEPVQVGCWVGENLCYVSAGPDGLDFGCHTCPGGCPPKRKEK